MEGFKSHPPPPGEIDEDIKRQHRGELKKRREEQAAAQKRRWKTRRWITFIAATLGAALFLFGLNLAVDWPGGTGRDVETGREIVTLDDVRPDTSGSAPSLPDPGTVSSPEEEE